MSRERFFPVAAMQPPVVWIEDRERTNVDFSVSWPKPPYLTDKEYGRCMEAFPRACADIIAIEPRSKRFYLVKRIHHSALGVWNFGGGIRRGQLPGEAAVMNLERETGIKLAVHELTFLYHTIMFWKRRNPAPQELGEHTILYTFCFVPTAEEIAKIKLDPTEYDIAHGIKLYDREELNQLNESHRDMLLVYHSAAFGHTT